MPERFAARLTLSLILLFQAMGCTDSTGTVAEGSEGPVTRQVAYAAATATGGNQLGIWLWYLEGTGYASHDALASDLAAMGVKRIFIKVGDGAYSAERWPEVNDLHVPAAYQGRGIEPWAWSYNVPGDAAAQATTLTRAAQTGYRGYVLDVEAEFEHQPAQLESLLKAFVAARQQALRQAGAPAELPLWATTFGNPADHAIDIALLDRYVDGHLPQTYLEVWGATYREAAAEWVRRGTEEYRQLGATKPIRHIFSIETNEISATQLNQAIRAAGPGASIWRVPGDGTPLAIWDTLRQVDWHVDLGTGLSGSLTVSCPAEVQRDQPVQISGHTQGSISLIKAHADHWPIWEGVVDPQGNYAFTQHFNTAGRNRQLRIQGFSARGEPVAEVTTAFSVVDEPTPQLTLVLPELARIGSPATFRGQASAGLVRIQATADGWPIGDEPVAADGTYTFTYTFFLAGSQRQIAVLGFDRSLRVAAQTSALLDVQASAAPVLTLTAPAATSVEVETILSGTATAGIRRVTITADGWLVGEEPIVNGAYQLRYRFTSPGQARQLLAQGLDDRQQVVAETRRTIDVAAADGPSLTLVAPAATRVGEATRFSGTARGTVVRVEVQADGWPLAEAEVVGGQYAFSYTFNTPGADRELIAAGLDVTGRRVVQVTRRIDIEATLAYIPDIPYFYQYANAIRPGASCQNTTMAMVLRHCGATRATPDSVSEYYGTVQAQSVAGWQSVFNSEAAWYGISCRDAGTTQGTFAELRRLLAAGTPVPVHGWFTPSGHVILLVGFDGQRYYAHDPAGRWNQIVYGGGYSGAHSTEGRYVTYGKAALEQAIGPDGTIWFHEIYRR